MTKLSEPYHYLKLNDGDELYQNIKQSEESFPYELKRDIRQFIFKEKESYQFYDLIGYYKAYYEDGTTFTDYYMSIIKAIGNGDCMEGENIVAQTFEKIATSIADKHSHINKDDVVRCLFFIHFYKAYNGFLAETVLKTTIEQSGLFTVYTDDVLDNKYKIDLLIKCTVEGYEDYAIGLQCKADTFQYLKDSKMDKYQNANQMAIDEKVATDIYYVLTKDFSVMKGLEHYSSIKALKQRSELCKQLYNPISAEDFIRELLYKFYEIKDTEMAETLPFGGFFRKYGREERFYQWYSSLNIA